MPQDGQTAARLRSVRREGADDNVATGPHGLRHALRIGLAARGFDEKMKRRAVVPQIIRFRWLPGGYVGGDPRHFRGPRPEPDLGGRKRALRKVENGRAKSLVQKGIHQPRRAAADIDYRGARFCASCPDEIKRDGRMLLKPAQLVPRPSFIDLVPVGLPVGDQGLPPIRRMNRWTPAEVPASALSKNRAADPYMGRAELNRELEIGAHAHRERQNPVARGDLVQKREMRRGLIVEGRNAHEA
jgi:hypothetical protein